MQNNINVIFDVLLHSDIGGICEYGKFRTKEINVLLNDALNTCYSRLYGVENMVKNHSDSERGNPLHGLFFSISSGD